MANKLPKLKGGTRKKRKPNPPLKKKINASAKKKKS